MNLDPAIFTVPVAQLPNISTPGLALAWQTIGGTVYQFASDGDAIPLHAHPGGQSHMTVILSGTVTYRTLDAQSVATDLTKTAGDVFMVLPDVEHSLIAQGGPAACINFRLSQLDPAQITKSLVAASAALDAIAAKVAATKALTV